MEIAQACPKTHVITVIQDGKGEEKQESQPPLNKVI